MHSKFDSNFGGNGATIDVSFYKGRFENVIFNNNKGPVIRVSDCISDLLVFLNILPV